MDKKVVLITGGATGIGLACAKQFKIEGYNVVILGRRIDVLKKSALEIDVDYFQLDSSDSEQCIETINKIISKYNKIDCLVCSAGQMDVGDLVSIEIDDWNKNLQANINSAFVISKYVLPELIKTKGNIVFISSIAALNAGGQVCSYTTTKHAMIGLMKSVAKDYGKFGIRSNAVCPGWVVTPMADEEMKPLMDKFNITLEEAYALVTTNVPLKRAATTQEIANICCFLASSQASIISGSIITADGGSSIVDVPTLIFDTI